MNREGGCSKAVGHPSQDLSPMSIHLEEEPFGGDEKVGAVESGWERERVSKTMAEVVGDTTSSRGQAANGSKGRL